MGLGSAGMSDELDSMTMGSITIRGTTEWPEVTWAVGDEGMPLGQQWVARGGDYPCVAHIPADEWAVIVNPADPLLIARPS